MSADPAYELSPDQKRYLTLTKECGLEHDEALFALGRRSGGTPFYRKLSRQGQYIKIQELVSLGLTQEEAERVVGISATVNAAKSLQAGTAASKTRIPSSSTEAEARPRCSGCKQAKESVVSVGNGVWLCSQCQNALGRARKALHKTRKADKRRREFAKYYNALTHPEFRGLKGVRK